MIDYDPHDWSSHLFDLKGSMLKAIAHRLLLLVAWAGLIELIHFNLRPIGVPATAHTITGVALGLLLVFRTNSSYDRFWEGRKQWGAIVNESRNLGRASATHLAKEPALHAAVLRWTAAFAYATMYSLRGERGLGPAGEKLPKDEVDSVLTQPHVPLAVATRLSALLRSARDRGVIVDYVYVALDQNVQLLIDYMGACERIHKTPMPFAYMLHLRRSLIAFLYTLPFALVRDIGWWTIVAVLIVGYVFFGIEEIGVEIEDPFGVDDNDLPLEAICGNIERNLVEQLGAVKRDDGLVHP